MQPLRPLIAVVLALTIALGSGAMAVARTQTDAARPCAETGPDTVPLKTGGQPAIPAHICPDCTLSQTPGMAPRLSLAMAPGRWTDVAYPALRIARETARMPCAKARAPPTA